MKESFKNFMEGIIDYAGMYPPAFLPLEKAFDNYRSYVHSDDNWMLSSFVCRASELSEVTSILEKENCKKPIKFSILLNNSGKFDVMISSIKRDISFIKYFQSYNKNLLPFSFELKLPEKVTGDEKRIADVLGEILRILNYEFYEYSIFFETFVLDKNWKTYVENLNSMLSISREKVGFKLRTGGIEPSLFPSAEKVAYIIKSADYHNVPLKATAGLHHPITHLSKEYNTTMYGFLNIFSAILLNKKFKLSANTISEIISDETAVDFKFLKNEFKWKEYSLTSEEIIRYRKDAVSFGSCSFDEPRDDLKKLKLL